MKLIFRSIIRNDQAIKAEYEKDRNLRLTYPQQVRGFGGVASAGFFESLPENGSLFVECLSVDAPTKKDSQRLAVKAGNLQGEDWQVMC